MTDMDVKASEGTFLNVVLKIEIWSHCLMEDGSRELEALRNKIMIIQLQIMIPGKEKLQAAKVWMGLYGEFLQEIIFLNGS